MRKVILGVAVSLDGFIEGPNGEYDWCFTDQDYGLSEFFRSVDTVFMGRKSYELTQQMQGDNPWNSMTTYVFSNSLKEVKGEKVKLISGNIEIQVKDMLKLHGKDIWMFGGAELLTTFVNHGWIDEYWLAVHPIILGAGKPLFQNIEGRKKLKLIYHKVYETGLVSLRYQPEIS
jgi:dihydrofolate reductase